MISIELHGRLGNQLFQYAVLRSLSIEKNYEIFYDINITWDNQLCLLSNFNVILPSTKRFRTRHKYRQQNGSESFNENIFQIKDKTKLFGHFVNEKYFIKNKDIIKKELTLKESDKTIWCDNYIKNLKKSGRKIVGIHIRRGDYVDIGNFEKKDEEDIFNMINKGLSIIEDKNIILLFFIGGSKNNSSENDIIWLKSKLVSYNNYKCIISPGSIESDILKDYYLLSKTDYSILSNHSSIALLACYVNSNKNKKIYINKNKQYLAFEEFISLEI